MKLSKTTFIFILLFLFGASFTFSQTGKKPKLGKGQVVGKIEKSGTCMGADDGICVRVGKYLLDLSTKGFPSTVFVGEKKLFTKGIIVKVDYSNLQDSEMDLDQLFTGSANRVTVIANKSNKIKRKIKK